VNYFVDLLSRRLARIAAVFYLKPVVTRVSDFKTNEHADLISGAQFEPREENPISASAARRVTSRQKGGAESHTNELGDGATICEARS
jgi:phosphoenolpyruvate synthase/pyruvate phosphate dikinase